MKNTHEYEILENVLKDEKAGSPRMGFFAQPPKKVYFGV